MNEPVSSREVTFYHYKLIRKIPLRPESKYGYMVTCVFALAVLFVLYGWDGLGWSMAALAVTVLVHALVVRVTVRRVDELARRRWAFRVGWPWLGPLPAMDTQLALFRRMHWHLLLVGCCAAGLLYPWTHVSFVIAMLYWHMWLLAPRFALLLKLRRERSDGVIRLESQEVSFYHQ